MAHLIPFLLAHLRRDEEGQTLVEYGLLLTFVALIVFLALVFLGPIVSGLYQDMGNSLAET